jgi:predicted dehydrogenase
VTLEEADAMIDACAKAGVLLMYAEELFFAPKYVKAKQMADEGAFGRIHLVKQGEKHSGPHSDWFWDVNQSGGGALMDVGCYPITISRWLFGAEPTEVMGLIDRDPDMQVDRLTSGMLRFERGQATFSCATQLVHYQAMQIFGTTGRIDVRIPFNPPPGDECRIFVDDGRDVEGSGIETITFPPVDQYTLQADRFSEAIRGVGSVPVSLEDAMGNMAVIDALFRSAESRRWERPES